MIERYSSFAPKVSIIILNWNGWEDTLECIESVYNINYPNYEIICIDNGSTNESVKKIKEYAEGKIEIKSNFFKYNYDNKPLKLFEYRKDCFKVGTIEENANFALLPSNKKLILILNKKNYGFTGGNNIGIMYAIDFLNPDYILLLNNDTVVDKNFLNELVVTGEENKKIGFFGPKIYFYEHKGRNDIIQYAGAKQSLWLFNPKHIGFLEKDKNIYDKLKKVDYAHGSCMLVRVEMIENIGLLDPDYFCYREENDWAIRGQKAGWGSMYVPTSKIWHKGGRSTGTISPMVIFYITRNDFILLKKHGNKLQIIIFIIYFLIYKFIFQSMAYVLYYRNVNAFLSLLSGFEEGILWKRKK